MKGGFGMKKQRRGYETGISNAGAQEVPALKALDRASRGKAVRGKDLRNGK